MSDPSTNNIAERKILAKLAKNPNIIFDIENSIKATDFNTVAGAKIFGAIEQIAEGNADLSAAQIDATILEEKVASMYPEYYRSQNEIVSVCIKKVFDEPPVADKDFIQFIRMVVNNSVKRRFLRKMDELKTEIEDINSPDLLASHIETSTIDFTSGLFRSNDIGLLGSNFESWLANKYEEKKTGKVHIGVTAGFPNYEICIGGGFRDGTISVIAARSKTGKSFLGLTMADNVAKQNIPVLYLDTELSDEYQTIRRVARITKIPLYQLESGQFIGDLTRELLAKNAIDELKKNKVYYVDIKGWSLEEQISIIRRFFAKIVGKDKLTGHYNKCLIVLDYLKLMNASDKNSDKEWEALGYRMTALHDLMSEFKSPMLAFAQQNREGLEREDEATISGSDRIIWLCDSFSIFSKMDEVGQAQQQQAVANDPNARKPSNAKLKVVCSRHGSGTPGRKFIGIYADIHDPTLKTDEVCGIIEERSLFTIQVSKQ